MPCFLFKNVLFFGGGGGIQDASWTSTCRVNDNAYKLAAFPIFCLQASPTRTDDHSFTYRMCVVNDPILNLFTKENIACKIVKFMKDIIKGCAFV